MSTIEIEEIVTERIRTHGTLKIMLVGDFTSTLALMKVDYTICYLELDSQCNQALFDVKSL